MRTTKTYVASFFFVRTKISFMKNHRKILPYHCLDKAYEASKRIQKIRKDFLLYKMTLLHQKHSRQSILSYTNAELNNSVFIVYLSLFQYRISFYLMNLFQLIRSRHPFFVKIIPNYGSFHKDYETNMTLTDSIHKTSAGQINRKLTWIEATLDDLYIWKRFYLVPSSYINEKTDQYSLSRTTRTELIVIAYESIGLLPRSITRTISRFKAELVNQSNSSVLREFGLAKYQALASLQYIGCLIIIPSVVSILSQKYFLEPWINQWWNNNQYQIFVASSQEEKALEELKEIEELFWLEGIVDNSLFGTQQDNLYNDGIYRKTIELVRNRNDNSIKTISHLLTDILYFVTLSVLFIMGKERLGILNSWAQELFYSLSDTMKAFFILLLTDLCIGFHSPHGWELVISCCLEHFGFIHDQRVISCFVSTFPVILDTVLKYLIFRHLNRISPSIVATYHTMNE